MMRIVAVMSPKGGVGKTTIAINLAWALRRRGVRVGLLDIDFHGPTLPIMLFGKMELPRVEVRDDVVKPVEYDGVKIFSLAFIASTDDVCMWSGETAQRYAVAMLEDVDWSGVDVLVVDTPPGLWDSNVEILAKADGVIVVTEPMLASVYDARKIVAVAKRKLVGIVVNEARRYAKMLSREEIEEILGYNQVYWVPFTEELQEDPRTRLEPIEQLADRILGG